MKHRLFLDGEADALWQKLPRGMRSFIMSNLLLDAYRQGKLDSFLSATESSPKPARAGEHKVENQKTGLSAQGRSQSGAAQTDRHDRGSGSKESHKLQQGQQGSKPTRAEGHKVGNQKASRRDKGSGSKEFCRPQQGRQSPGPIIKKPSEKNCPTSLKTEKDSLGPVKEGNGESDDKGSSLHPKWLKEWQKNFREFGRGKKK